MVVLAFLTDPDVVGAILKHLGLPRAPVSLAPARIDDLVEQLELFGASSSFPKLASRHREDSPWRGR
jgi:hypothetical protein